MKGWKTYTAATALAVLGILTIIQGDVPGGIQQIVSAMALTGVGHKLDKAGF
jgi:hypothetical protein